jgi:cytosine/adenosine deaminase-related metal-dependent hydrolase
VQQTSSRVLVLTAIIAKDSRLALFDSYGIVDPDTHWVVSHATNPALGDAKLLEKHNMYMSAAPSSAMQMTMGHPTALYHRTEDFFPRASVGADSHAICGSSLPSEMRILLQDARAQFNDSFVEQWKSPAKLNRSVEDVFNLATVKGARALGMADQIGQLKVGMAADIVVYNGSTPALYGGAQTNPVTAIVMLSSPADVELTMIDGIIRKENGMLKDVRTAPKDERWREGASETLTWTEISAKLIKKSKTMRERIQSVDEDQMRKDVMQFLRVDPAVVV